MAERNLDLSNEEYHAGPGVSKSDLDLIARSPAHYVAAKELGRKVTPAMITGSMFHTLVLEPESFLLEYAVCPVGIDRRTKAGKASWASFEAESDGKQIVKREDLSAIQAMADSILRHPLARPLVTGGVAEQSIFWQTSVVEGITCKCRPDFVKDLGEGRYAILQNRLWAGRRHRNSYLPTGTV